MKRTALILCVMMIGLLSACAVPPKTAGTAENAVTADMVRQTEAKAEDDLTLRLANQTEIKAEERDAYRAEEFDRLLAEAETLLTKAETAKADGDAEKADALNEAYEKAISELNAQLFEK